MERLGLTPLHLDNSIVVHAASVGEVIALRPFIQKLQRHYPNHTVVVTTFTPTGSAQVYKSFGENMAHCYLPIDTPFAINRFLDRLKPQMLVLMETEIWPCLIDHCHTRSITLMLINGRISTRSFPRYQKISRLIRPTLAKIDKVLTQTQADAERFANLGVRAKVLTSCGNIKYDLAAPSTLDEQAEELGQAFAGRKIWVIGSSHQDEEGILFDSILQVRKANPGILCIIAPRHPERVNAVVSQAKEKGLQVVQRSHNTLPTATDDLWVIDTMGELLLFYRIATVCTIAGSFGATGGHNPLEAALFSRPMVVGHNMANFRDIAEHLENAKGWKKLANTSPQPSQALSKAVNTLLDNPEDATQLGQNAHTVLQQNQGATKRILLAFDALLQKSDLQQGTF